MICACQKQDSTAEAQLAQRKAELDAREKALDEREKAVSEREKAVANSRIIQSRKQARNPAEVEAEQRKAITTAPAGASCTGSQPRAGGLCKACKRAGSCTSGPDARSRAGKS